VANARGPRPVRDLVAFLETVGQPGERVLSAFVDTSDQAGGWRAALEALRDASHLVRRGVPVEEHPAFDRAVALAAAYLTTADCPKPGLALFVDPNGPVSVVALPTRPIEVVAWEDHPAARALAAALSPSSRIGVVRSDRRRHRNRCVNRRVDRRPPQNRGIP
jgi:hypothetical protein